MSYYFLKHFHMSFALVSGFLFIMRGLWTLQQSSLAQRRSLRLAAHVINTALVASAIGLSLVSTQQPWLQPWLTVKLLALLAYITAANVALRRDLGGPARVVAFATALLLFVYILKLAVIRQTL